MMRAQPAWKSFRVIPLSHQADTKRLTLLIRNESVPPEDIVTWLCRFGQVLAPPKKEVDTRGIWTGSWTVPVKLRRVGLSVTHVPSLVYIGRDRIWAFYLGQPKVCHKCNSPLHYSASCTQIKSAKFNEVGHSTDPVQFGPRSRAICAPAAGVLQPSGATRSLGEVMGLHLQSPLAPGRLSPRPLHSRLAQGPPRAKVWGLWWDPGEGALPWVADQWAHQLRGKPPQN